MPLSKTITIMGEAHRGTSHYTKLVTSLVFLLRLAKYTIFHWAIDKPVVHEHHIKKDDPQNEMYDVQLNQPLATPSLMLK